MRRPVELVEAIELQHRMNRTDRSTDRGTLRHDELRKRRNRRLLWLYRDDPERWSMVTLAQATGLSEATVHAIVRPDKH